MPYLIETYGKSLDGSKLLLKDIDTYNQFATVKEATEHINTLIDQQKKDNDSLLAWHYEQVRSQLFDENTDDRILREPRLYNYTFKAAKYSKGAIKRIP